MRYAAALAVLVAAGNSAMAHQIRLICFNGVRDYVVRFDETRRTFSYDGTPYKVLAVEAAVDGVSVSGLTVGDGPTFRAWIGPGARVECFEKSKLFETDRCR